VRQLKLLLGRVLPCLNPRLHSGLMKTISAAIRE
jgi:hypothetical protein